MESLYAYASTPETTNANRASRAVLGPCTDGLRDLLRHRVPPHTFPHVIKQNQLNLPRLTAAQRDLILPRHGDYTGNYRDMDISLLYILLRHISVISPHSKGWGNDPDPSDRSLSANIERIRLVRNRCVFSSDVSMSNSDFNSIWSTIKWTMVDLDAFFMNGNKYEKAVDFLRHESMDPENDLHYEEELRKQVEEDKTTREIVARLKKTPERTNANSYESTPETTNTNRACRVILGPCTDGLRDLLRHYVLPHTFPHVIKQNKHLPRLTAAQRDLILPRHGDYTGNYRDMGISLLYILLRNIFVISPHSKGWGNDPDPSDRSLSANIERIRLVRNRCVFSSDVSMSNSDFYSIWSTIRRAMVDLDAFFMNGNKYEKAVDFLRHESMDPENDLHYQEELRKQVEEDKTTREIVASLKILDPMAMCLLLCPAYKLDINEHIWISIYNTIAEKFGFTAITKLTDLSQLEKYKPVLDISESEITFSSADWRDKTFLKSAKSHKFLEIFLNRGEKENIAKYCRSPSYRKIEGEVCYCLSPSQTEKFVERLGEDIFTHSAFQDQSIKKLAFQKIGIPMQIIMRGDQSVQNFIQNLQKGKQKMYHASGMIIGCAGSGKTTLLKRLQGITVEEIKRSTESTRGVNVFTDVFDVTDTLQVTKSGKPQRFRVTLDKPNHDDNQISDMENDQVQEDIKKTETDELCEDMKDKHVNVHRRDSKEEDAYFPQNSEGTDRSEVSEVHNTMEEIKVDFSPPQPHPEMSSIIQVSQESMSDDEINLTKKISMTDFAGQCAYYASHQIFLNPRAFFLLVLDMKKKLDDVVDEEVCCQEGSVYKKWTFKDYLEFWLKSVHQFSSDKAPVLLVATHCEDTTEEARKKYFWNLWKTLSTKDKSLLEHLAKNRKFSVTFDDDEEIQKLKNCIVETVQTLDHWGQNLPQSWGLFEIFLLEEKKKKKILKRDEVIDFNKRLGEELQLNDGDIDVMLQFFHDIREILYFDQADLKDAIILDIQWFSDAFKHIITDKNHAEDDLLDRVDEWEIFNETGVLNGQLLNAIWEIHSPNCNDYKKEIMLYMEKLGLLATFNQGEEKWYVPSMNKTPFEKQTLSSWSSSSILCFQFDVLPVGIFHRLVAVCIQIPLEILACGDKQCIYQTAAIFMHDDHHFVIGMTKSAIQLQVFVFSGNVNPTCCRQIRQKMKDVLHTCSNTFQSNFKFSVGYKCKVSGFCDEEESKVISEEKFTKSSFVCPGCPVENKHMIETNSITKYWTETMQPSSSSKKNRQSGCELLLDHVARNLQDMSASRLAGWLNVIEPENRIRDEKEKRFRVLYSWKCKFPSIDHKKNLQRILVEAEQVSTSESMDLFDKSEFHCSGVPRAGELVSYRDFEIISQHLSGDYTHFARFLEIPHQEIEQIEEISSTIKDKILNLFKNIDGNPTYPIARQDVCNALMYIGKNNVIEELKEF